MARTSLLHRLRPFLVAAALLPFAFAQTAAEWEYLVVAYDAPAFEAPRTELSAEAASRSKVLRFAELGIPLPQEATEFQRQIDVLGRFGWELVTAVATIDGNPQLIFKRPYDAERSAGEAARIEAERAELLAAFDGTRTPPRVADATAPQLLDLDAVERAQATVARNERDAEAVRARIDAAATAGFLLADLTLEGRALAPDSAADVRVRVAQDVTNAALVGTGAYRRSLALGAHEEFLAALGRGGLALSDYAFCAPAQGVGTGRVQLVVDLVIEVDDTRTVVATRRSTHCFVEPGTP